MADDWKDILASLASESPSPSEEEAPAPQPDTPASQLQEGTLHVVVEKKGRKGKVATIIEGFTIDDDAVEQIASELKRKIGTGGSARGGEILLQGEWKEKVITLLKEKGFKAK